ncbi:MAG: hypothetical protein UV61_C0002G0102 [Candidatus Gottesmanbacteria bacterium GW2011_GWB1_43_11]|uniref:Gcp-like domain-containing protein n=1 Tax=Candidatus Gottesmanbacteria bacterium GW2011_GWB1_43_11 TaxID=1618446 RepID=A0A0G1EWI2_9BACT|nr:MAG: hypothetical protein UV04_C0028G0015 [Candidatus Gottesmanbacteria bacterium GW2011_GWA2_42_16]KKS53472.1 MAG: hypothetical protein UV17_C0036G0002 [Candidatus Gottesmanbacteria bacterium GW2011_GWA1_42_26]KKS81813.1 MAG: YdiC [Candidatus Gottesmanbacteria bacterium GW2011_GWC1_43_10]KKS87381.1 MAG: hypothetical protein UV61_C0002G0102 [Candidatus Gottesmanbacteria bacterium GW2011_GWB1_43_11]OGG10531.1 MAG: tRNA (adenosine(37)-N6)-threonylcarbamoyltransferase complex dimerization subun
MITLYIDTSDSGKTTVALIIDGIRKEYVEVTNKETRSQNVLPLIEKALQSEKLTLKDLTDIKVHPGPGSFTGVRVGVAVANTLGWTLKIPVNGKPIELPQYAASKFDI